ncbi:MAG: hypothetical protein ABI746_11265 [Dermatophilaceae bacterium]
MTPAKSATQTTPARLQAGDLLPAPGALWGSGKPGDPRDTLARVFQDTTNRMLSGYLLRQVVNPVNKVEFSHRDDSSAPYICGARRVSLPFR